VRDHTTKLVGDFQDLPFDLSNHEEALKSFAALNLLPQSIKPALCARDLIFVKVPSCKFRIGVTSEPDVWEKIDSNGGTAAFEVIYKATSPEEADLVRGEVERYFLRHYPGRILSGGNASVTGILFGNFVYISCHTSVD
jgi:hypothetical protein